MSRLRLRFGLTIVVAVSASLVAAPVGSAASASDARDDTMVMIEVLTDETGAVGDAIEELGGTVVGSVEGEIVQAEVPSDQVDEVASAEDVTFVRPPQLVSRPPTQPRLRADVGPGFGAVIGQNVEITNAAAWQAAGIDGSVKVGIIDYFDLGLWNPVENGPVPDVAHRFCLDSAASGLCDPLNSDGVNDGDGFEHGVAVAQVVRDMAPAAELFIASTATVSDLRAAIDWFAQNGVMIITRSLGAAYDGPGDGTGPLAAVVDYAAARGITWFNSTGNDAQDGYARIVVPADLGQSGGYVDFDNGPGVDTYLRLSGQCVLFDGVRWNDWDKPANLRTDYIIETWAPIFNPDLAHGEGFNPPDLQYVDSTDDVQANGAPPLEAADAFLCAQNNFGFADGISYIRIQRKPGTSTAGDPDIVEIALGSGYLELGRSQASYSAAKPVVDSLNPQLIAVGAIDPADGSGSPEAIASYSSQGPTNDGRIKPDVSAPSCVASPLYQTCFNGTSAASPSAAGMAALLLDAGVALPGPPLAAAVRHFTVDRNAVQGSTASPDGPDNKYGIGQIRLPSPPTVAAPVAAAAYQALTPTRVLDTRTTSPVGPPRLVGKLPPQGILDLAIAGVGAVPASATAVAVNITSTDAPLASYIQAVPFLRSPFGASSTLNIAVAGSVKPNFAIVPLGVDGKISVYTVAGGNIIVDVLGYFAPTDVAVAAGRFVAIDPTRTLDTRTVDLVPTGWSAHLPTGESVVVPAAANVPASGVSALVLNVTSTDALAPGFLRAEPTGSVPSSSTVNYVPGSASANTVIVPLGANGTVSVFTSAGSHIVVDVTGYITDATAAVVSTGRFVPVPTGRAYDSRSQAAGALVGGGARSVQLTGLASPLPVIPAGVVAISLNLTATDEVGPGFLTAYPGAALPPTSTLNFSAGQPVANGALLKLSALGGLNVFALQQSHFVIDLNGYFTG